MTEQQIKDCIEFWGDRLPDPQHCPRQFKYYVLLYKHIKGIQ